MIGQAGVVTWRIFFVCAIGVVGGLLMSGCTSSPGAGTPTGDTLTAFDVASNGADKDPSGESTDGANGEDEEHEGCDSHEGEHHDGDDETELKAELADGGFRARVEYELEGQHREFELEVTGGEPGATLDVSANGVVVLSITLDSSGAGQFEFSSDPDDSDEQPLPADFPELSPGDVIAIGSLSGPLEVEQDD